jgi:uroporphyrin-III C-methyltransferase
MPMPPESPVPVPVFLDLADVAVLVVGGGDAAAAQVLRLLPSGAVLRVVDPAPGAALEALAGQGALTLLRRDFAEADLDGVRLCCVALEDAAEAAAVVAAAKAQGVLVQAAERPAPSMPSIPAAPRRGAAVGRATLVGAGPGDPELLTLKALRALSEADVVLYDKLVDPRVLDLAPRGARRIDVGKRCGRHSMSQAAINALLVREVRAGAHVVRLKGGDPFVFGRGGEELEALRASGAEVEVVPGITAALAAAARLGLPLTHRGLARGLHLITAHGAEEELPAQDWRALAAAGGTLAVYMGSRTLPRVAAALIDAGMAPGTPAIAVENASLPGERRIPATLDGITAAVAAAAVEGPTLVLIGAVVALAGSAAAPGCAIERHAA